MTIHKAVYQFSLSEEPLGLAPIIQARVSDEAVGLNQSSAWPDRIKYAPVCLGSQGLTDLPLAGHG